MPDAREIGTDGIVATLDTRGGRIASIRVDGVEYLATEESGRERLQSGCYPMVPWAGRLGGGTFAFEDARHRLPAHFGGHAIHGLATDIEWRLDDATMTCSLEDRWPLGGRAKVDYAIDGRTIHADLTVEATDLSMPAALGWHPCFRREIAGESDVLAFSAGFMWERGPDHLPTGRRIDVPNRPWDDCFGEVAYRPSIGWGARAVTLDSPTKTWVVFDELEDIICVEPQTAPPNAFSLGESAVLQPGESLSLPLTLSF